MADNATEQPERLGPPACHTQSGVNQQQPQAAQRELLLIQQVSKQLLGTSSVLDAQRPDSEPQGCAARDTHFLLKGS